jgi:hypothetical protein
LTWVFAKNVGQNVGQIMPRCPWLAALAESHFRACVTYLSHTKGKHAIIQLARVMHDRTCNLMPLPSIFPDYPAPIIRNTPEVRELAMALQGRNSDPGVTNIRNSASPHGADGSAPRAGVSCHSPAFPNRNPCPMAASRRSGLRWPPIAIPAFFAGIRCQDGNPSGK